MPAACNPAGSSSADISLPGCNRPEEHEMVCSCPKGSMAFCECRRPMLDGSDCARCGRHIHGLPLRVYDDTDRLRGLAIALRHNGVSKAVRNPNPAQRRSFRATASKASPEERRAGGLLISDGTTYSQGRVRGEVVAPRRKQRPGRHTGPPEAGLEYLYPRLVHQWLVQIGAAKKIRAWWRSDDPELRRLSERLSVYRKGQERATETTLDKMLTKTLATAGHTLRDVPSRLYITSKSGIVFEQAPEPALDNDEVGVHDHTLNGAGGKDPLIVHGIVKADGRSPSLFTYQLDARTKAAA